MSPSRVVKNRCRAQALYAFSPLGFDVEAFSIVPRCRGKIENLRTQVYSVSKICSGHLLVSCNLLPTAF